MLFILVLYLELELKPDWAWYQIDLFLLCKWIDIQNLGIIYVSLQHQGHLIKV